MLQWFNLFTYFFKTSYFRVNICQPFRTGCLGTQVYKKCMAFHYSIIFRSFYFQCLKWLGLATGYNMVRLHAEDWTTALSLSFILDGIFLCTMSHHFLMKIFCVVTAAWMEFSLTHWNGVYSQLMRPALWKIFWYSQCSSLLSLFYGIRSDCGLKGFWNSLLFTGSFCSTK